MYYVFVRNWWKKNPSWPNGLEPDPCAQKYTITSGIETEEEAREIAQEYNRTHEPGKLSRKAEFDCE